MNKYKDPQAEGAKERQGGREEGDREGEREREEVKTSLEAHPTFLERRGGRRPSSLVRGSSLEGAQAFGCSE